MASSHPVILIHAAPWCGACKKFLEADNMSKVTKTIHSINPNTEIKVIYHSDFKNTNKTDEYPQLNYIPAFPMMMVTDSTNCTRKGTMDKVKILGYKWNGNSIVKGDNESIDAFFKRTLTPGANGNGNGGASMSANSQIQPPIINEVTKPAKPIAYTGKTKREERHFRLIGSSND